MSQIIEKEIICKIIENETRNRTEKELEKINDNENAYIDDEKNLDRSDVKKKKVSIILMII